MSREYGRVLEEWRAVVAAWNAGVERNGYGVEFDAGIADNDTERVHAAALKWAADEELTALHARAQGLADRLVSLGAWAGWTRPLCNTTHYVKRGWRSTLVVGPFCVSVYLAKPHKFSEQESAIFKPADHEDAIAAAMAWGEEKTNAAAAVYPLKPY